MAKFMMNLQGHLVNIYCYRYSQRNVYQIRLALRPQTKYRKAEEEPAKFEYSIGICSHAVVSDDMIIAVLAKEGGLIYMHLSP